MDGLKGFFDAVEARVRSKILGSIILTFILINWKVIFYVVFAKVNPEIKFTYFDDHTNLLTLFVIPFFAGVIFALVMPWVNYGAMKLTSKPDRKQRDFKNESESLNELSKLKYKTEREEFIARLKAATVKSAKADEAAKNIENEAARNKAQQELLSVTEGHTRVSVKTKTDSLKDKESTKKGYSLDRLKDEIGRYDNIIQTLNDAVKSYKKTNAKLYVEEGVRESRYKKDLIQFKKSNNKEAITASKLQRAKEMEVFSSKTLEMEETFIRLKEELSNARKERALLEAALDAKYGL